MKRNQNYDFYRRISLHYSDQIGGMNIPWNSDIVSSDGAHYHVWIPKMNAWQETDMLERFKSAARRHGDPVSFSWDYIPKDACEVLTNKRMKLEEFQKTNFIWHRIENYSLPNGDMLISGVKKPGVRKSFDLPMGAAL